MTQFAAIKIHYDHRKTLPPHLKYSVLPSKGEYEEYLKLYRENGIGGNGFHECLNFSIPKDGPVRIYLPPTCLPSTEKSNDEFIIFSFTYKDDPSLSANIVGVHAGVRILSNKTNGVPRPIAQEIKGIEPMHYHCEAPADLVTLFTPSLPYDLRDGIYTRVYERWGFGRRYINSQYARSIISDAYQKAEKEFPRADTSKQIILQRQLDVLTRIDARYNLQALSNINSNANLQNSLTSLPDKEIGYLGERYIYQKELAYADNIKQDRKNVEWVSQSVPNAPFDIKTIRLENGIIREHFIEVKTSTSINEGGNIYISSQQIEFMRVNEGKSCLSLVLLDSDKKPSSIEDFTLSELFEIYDATPIKYKLNKKPAKGS